MLVFHVLPLHGAKPTHSPFLVIHSSAQPSHIVHCRSKFPGLPLIWLYCIVRSPRFQTPHYHSRHSCSIHLVDCFHVPCKVASPPDHGESLQIPSSRDHATRTRCSARTPSSDRAVMRRRTLCSTPGEVGQARQSEGPVAWASKQGAMIAFLTTAGFIQRRTEGGDAVQKSGYAGRLSRLQWPAEGISACRRVVHLPRHQDCSGCIGRSTGEFADVWSSGLQELVRWRI